MISCFAGVINNVVYIDQGKDGTNMKKFKKLAALLLALTMVFALAACGNDADNNSQAPSDNPPASEPANPDDSNSAEPAPGGDVQTNEDGMTYVNVTGDIDLSGVDLSGKTFGYVTINSSAPWGGRVGTEFARLAEEAGATVQSLDANTNPDDVTNYCNQMLDAGVDALVVFGGTPDAMVEIAQRCSDEGVALFLTAQDVAEAGRQYATACIGPDQEKAFTDIANYIIEANGTEEDYTVVQISGVPFLDDYIQREAGFKAGMDAAPNYTLLAADYAYSSRPDAKTFMENHLQAEGDAINIVIGYDDDLTMGAVDAIDEAGKTGQIKVYSFTGQNDAIQAVADGKMELTVMNRADNIAKETVKAAYEYFTTGSTAYYHYTELTYITADNAADFVGKGEF